MRRVDARARAPSHLRGTLDDAGRTRKSRHNPFRDPRRTANPWGTMLQCCFPDSPAMAQRFAARFSRPVSRKIGSGGDTSPPVFGLMM